MWIVASVETAASSERLARVGRAERPLRRAKKPYPSTLWHLDKTEEAVIYMESSPDRGGMKVKNRRIAQAPAPVFEVGIPEGGGGGSESKAAKRNVLRRRRIRSSHAIGTVSREAVRKAVREVD